MSARSARSRRFALAALLAAPLASLAVLDSQQRPSTSPGPAALWSPGTAGAEWRTYGGDLGNTRYSPLDQITAANFNRLEVAWRFNTESLGPAPEYKFESTPLMVGGVVYSTAGTRRAVVALDAATGELIWMHSEREGERGTNAPRQLSGRGLAYWTDGQSARIIYVTPGYRLIALDAKTGAPVSTFGQNGVVDLKQDDDQAMDLVKADIGLHAAPVVAKDVIIVGAAHSAGVVPKSKTNVKGYVRGFDVRTGKRLWIFHTIPTPGEFGADTWLNNSASYTGNAGVWAQISVDEALDTVYLPVELPTGDHYGGNRPGAGLFGESLVAVDLHTGVLKWHYQLVHHGMWDMDIPCGPILADITVNGRTIKAVAQPTKQSWLYVFDRVTGQPVWPIEERPAPKGDTPGEWYSPTQPFVTRPAPYDRQGVSEDDLVDFTPELHAQALENLAKYRHGPIFTPPSVGTADGTYGTLTLPNNNGGANWPGGALDPDTHLLYVFSQTLLANFSLTATDPAVNDNGIVARLAAGPPRASGAGPRGGGAGPAGRGAAPVRSVGPAAPAASAGNTEGADSTPPAVATFGGGRAAQSGALTIQGIPIVKPPYGRITAIDLNTGTIAWQVAHGDTPDTVRNSPALKGATIPRTGQSGIIGVLATKTLLIAGEPSFTTADHPRGALLRAYDKATGADAGKVLMAAPQTGSPMTYLLNGRQYIVVAIGGPGVPGQLVAYRLAN